MFQIVLFVYYFIFLKAKQNKEQQSFSVRSCRSFTSHFFFFCSGFFWFGLVFWQETSLSISLADSVSFVLTLSVAVQFCLLRRSNATDSMGLIHSSRICIQPKMLSAPSCRHLTSDLSCVC